MNKGLFTTADKSNLEVLQNYSCDRRFSERQIDLIKYGLRKGLDVTVFAHPDIPESIMEIIIQHMMCIHNYKVYHTVGDCDKVLVGKMSARNKNEVLEAVLSANSNVTVINIELCSLVEELQYV